MDDRTASIAPWPALQAAAWLLGAALASASGAAAGTASGTTAGTTAAGTAAGTASNTPAGTSSEKSAEAFASGDEGIERLQPGLARQVRQLALDGSRQSPVEGARRVEIHLGTLNPRLRLAPCQRIDPYLPAGTALWGKTRIGLRCAQGTTPWNVFLPVTVNVFGTGWVAAAPLPAGSVLAAADLTRAEVDLASQGTAVTELQPAVGRTLARALHAGQALRSTDLKLRQWFAAGDEVKVASRGNGFSVAGSGQALSHGLEGQPVRVRAESGRVLVGMPVGERLVELPP